MSIAVELKLFVCRLPFDTAGQHSSDNLDELDHALFRTVQLKDLIIRLRSREAQNRRGISR
jgi:hypothetical protein